MKQQLSISSVSILGLILTAHTIAQSTSCPPGYDSMEAAGYSYALGNYPNYRCQVMHGENKGTPGSYNKLSLRVDRFPYGSPFAGRRWNNVVLRIAEGPKDYASTKTWYTHNHLTTATTVFISSSVHWPAVTPPYGLDPMPWGAPDNGLAFPFGTTWMYSGNNGVCADFDMRGGTLDNARPWTSNESYYLDAVPRYTAGGPIYRLYGDQNCHATGRSTYNEYHPEIATYAADYPTYKGKFRYVFRYFGLPARAASTGAVIVIAIGGDPAGTRFLNSCNPLHVDLGKVITAVPFLPDSSGRGYAPFASHQLLDYDPALAGTEVWSQIAYDDGNPPRLQLTMAGRSRMWRIPNANRSVLFGPGTLTGTRSADQVPVLYLQ